MHLRPWTKEWMWSCHVMEKCWQIACNDGEKNLSWFERSPMFEERKQWFKEERSNEQLSMDIIMMIKNSYIDTDIIPDDLMKI